MKRFYENRPKRNESNTRGKVGNVIGFRNRTNNFKDAEIAASRRVNSPRTRRALRPFAIIVVRLLFEFDRSFHIRHSRFILCIVTASTVLFRRRHTFFDNRPKFDRFSFNRSSSSNGTAFTARPGVECCFCPLLGAMFNRTAVHGSAVAFTDRRTDG